MSEHPGSSDPILAAPPWIVGHRGAAAEALENTLESLELAVEQAADMIELDVQLTADGELVAFHDWDLVRLADRKEVVEESRLGSLAEVFPPLVTLREVLDALPPSVPLNVELKVKNADRGRFTSVLAETLGQRSGILISCFDWELLAATRERLPRTALAPLAHESTDGLLEIADRLGAWAVHCHHSLASEALIDAARAVERPVLVYTVNEADLARTLFESGVSGVFTDAPGRLRTELGL